MAPVIVYVHGVGNKPPAEALRRQWDQALFGAALDSRSRMAYWADLCYPKPLGEAGAVDALSEEVATAVEGDGDRQPAAAADPETFVRTALAEAAAAADGAEAGAADTDELAEWARRMTYAADALAAGEAPAASPGEELLPLPRPLRQAAFRALVKVTLKDVYAYFFGGQREEIQERLRAVLRDVDGPAVVVGHSLGSVIAYDVLRSWHDRPLTVPLLVTLGSPLGVQEIEDVVVQPLEVPASAASWVNACDARDVVALDPTLRDEYVPSARLRDYIVPNDSEIHHDIGAYLRAAVVQQVVHAAMGGDGDGPQEAGGGRPRTGTGPPKPSAGAAGPSSRPARAGRGPEDQAAGADAGSADPLQQPITNIAPVESGVTEAMVSEPELGEAQQAPPPANGVESIAAHRDREAAMVLTAPTAALLDVGAASFGGPDQPVAPPVGTFRKKSGAPIPGVLESVLGQDDRIQVQDTEQYPWSAIASLLITARDGSQWIGTGWFVSPRTLLTAGHCVYITNSPVTGRNGWVLSIQVLPGRNGTALPFGSATATQFWTVQGWADGGREDYDYGAIVLPTPLGTQVGTFGFAVLPDDDLSARTLNVAGYPGDKPPGTLWYATRETASLTASKVYYAIDTAGGQSGAPVFVVDGDRRLGVAVHAYGGATTNSGSRISPDVFENVSAWKQ